MKVGALRLVAGFAATTSLALALLAWRRHSRVWNRIRRVINLDGRTCAVRSQRSGSNVHVSLDSALVHGQLPFQPPFCSATVSRCGLIHVAGTIGLAGGDPGRKPELERGGIGPETTRTLELMDAALRAAGSSTDDITMIHIYLTDYTAERFAAMNAAYTKFFGDRPLPARITSGSTHLALGASVEMDAVAFAP